MTLSPTVSRWSFLVFFFCGLAFVSCIFVSPFKKNFVYISFLFYLFSIPCIQFIANLLVNSLQILVRSYLSSELRWQVFSLWWTRSHRFVASGPTKSFRCNRSIPLGATDFTTGKPFCHLFLLYFWSSSTQWILSSTSITFLLVLCVVTQGPNPFTTNSRRPFLEIDVKGGER